MEDEQPEAPERLAILDALRREAAEAVARAEFPNLARELRHRDGPLPDAPECPDDLAEFLRNRVVHHPTRRSSPREHFIILALLSDLADPHHGEGLRMVLDAVRAVHEAAGVKCPAWVSKPFEVPLIPGTRKRRKSMMTTAEDVDVRIDRLPSLLPGPGREKLERAVSHLEPRLRSAYTAALEKLDEGWALLYPLLVSCPNPEQGRFRSLGRDLRLPRHAERYLVPDVPFAVAQAVEECADVFALFASELVTFFPGHPDEGEAVLGEGSSEATFLIAAIETFASCTDVPPVLRERIRAACAGGLSEWVGGWKARANAIFELMFPRDGDKADD